MVKDLHIQFKTQLNRLDTGAYTNIRTEVIDYLLTVSYCELVRTQHTISKLEGIGQVEAMENISPLIKYTTVINKTAGPDPNGYLFEIPSKVWYIELERANIKYTDACSGTLTSKLTKVRPVPHKKLHKYLDDPFNKPWHEEVLRTNYNGQHEIILFEDCIISSYFLSYVEKPKILIHDTANIADSIFNINGALTINDFTDTQQLNSKFDDSIVAGAVALALKGFQNQPFVGISELYKL